MLMNGTNTAQCNCYQGFYGEFCELDLDECVVSSSPCPAGYECHNLYGTFECVPCPPGSKCELTTTTPIMTTTVPPAPAPVPINSVNRVNKNESLLEACSLCKNNATCMINDETDEIVCICQLGYSGFYCELEMDICESGEACLNNGTCILDEKSPGGYICECPRGYSGEICEQSKCLLNVSFDNSVYKINISKKSIFVIWRIHVFIKEYVLSFSSITTTRRRRAETRINARVVLITLASDAK